jgi:hypothetical protein
MPEITTSFQLSLDDQGACDLVIDTFDQWHNSPEALLKVCLQTFCGAFPADVVDPV